MQEHSQRNKSETRMERVLLNTLSNSALCQRGSRLTPQYQPQSSAQTVHTAVHTACNITAPHCMQHYCSCFHWCLPTLRAKAGPSVLTFANFVVFRPCIFNHFPAVFQDGQYVVKQRSYLKQS